MTMVSWRISTVWKSHVLEFPEIVVRDPQTSLGVIDENIETGIEVRMHLYLSEAPDKRVECDFARPALDNQASRGIDLELVVHLSPEVDLMTMLR